VRIAGHAIRFTPIVVFKGNQHGADMPDDDNLNAQACDAILAGRLPSERPQRVLAGPGLGEACAICREPVSADQFGYEVEVDRLARATIQLHVRCFAAWARASRELEDQADTDTAIIWGRLP
jgi:hypothetical protein